MSEAMNQDNPGTPPKVSIGMPVYNGEPFIYKALDSLLAQTYTDFELIISDNASTDATLDICKEYAEKDSRISYIRQPRNMGVLFNFNFVLDQARSEYFMWAAADDVWDQNCIMKWLSVLSTDDDVALVFSNFGIYLHNSDKLILNQDRYISPCLSNNKCIRLMQRMLNPCPSMFYGLFRKSMLKGFELKHFDWFDVYFTNYLSLRGKVVVLSDYLYYAGIKEADGVRIVQCAKDGKLNARDFFVKMLSLICQNCSFVYIVPLIVILLKQSRFLYSNN
ncbi:MAG: glycosyltransferase family 2 protein [Desulfobacterales bacterium]|nr:glycosyltransferase family 2 protein [Desulfobacterales bacterium]